MPIVVDKSVSCELLLTKFTPKVGQVYPPVENPSYRGKKSTSSYVVSLSETIKELSFDVADRWRYLADYLLR